MKSQIYVFIMALLPLVGDVIKAQPKLSIDMGIGFYEPTLVGFDENETVQFPTKSIFNRNMLFNWGIYYEFFNNARIGYNSFTSYEIGKNILLINSEAVFRRSLTYRIFPIETFFRLKPKIELNFTLAPIWGRARIEMDTTPSRTLNIVQELFYLLLSFLLIKVIFPQNFSAFAAFEII